MALQSSFSRVPLLITPRQLQALPKATTKILDCSWHMPNANPPRDPNAEYVAGPRIPLAQRWDLDKVSSDSALGLKHMLPEPARFSQACSELGIQQGDHVVLYDSVGLFSSPRGAWTFKTFGHEKVSVLDGGLPRWKHEGFEVENDFKNSKSSSGTSSDYHVSESLPGNAKSYEEVVANTIRNPADNATELVFDARSAERWSGAAPEPRPGLSSGHMPNSLSLPFNTLLQPSSSSKPYTSYLPPIELRRVILASIAPGQSDKTAQIRWEEIKRGKRGVTWTCGSGMTAAVGIWAMRVLAAFEERDEGMRIGLYDESWTGYAMRDESKIIKSDQ